MAVKTSLQVRTTNPTTSETKLKTATFSNPDATNAQLNSFAQKMYGNSGLSANTVDSVIRVDKLNITNAESDTTPEPTGAYALWTPEPQFYDINNAAFSYVLINSDIGGMEQPTIISISPEGGYLQAVVEYEGETQTTTESLETLNTFFSHVIYSVTRNDKVVSIPKEVTNYDWAKVAEILNCTLQDVADMIMQSKFIEILSAVTNDLASSLTDTKRVNVSYVPATNSIRVDPVEGIEDNFYIRYQDPIMVYQNDYETLRPQYYEGAVIGHNTTFNIERGENYITLGLKS